MKIFDEERIIACLSETRNISLEAAMNIYYYSKLADKIQRRVEGIQYLDYENIRYKRVRLSHTIIRCSDGIVDMQERMADIHRTLEKEFWK